MTALEKALRDVWALTEVPYTDTQMGPVVTVADLRRVLLAHWPVGVPSPAIERKGRRKTDKA